MKIILLTKHRFTTVSDEDFDFLSQWKWQALGPDGYASMQRRIDGQSKRILMHRLIWEQMTGAKPDGVIHHINNDNLDNRRENLECLTIAEHKEAHPTKIHTKWKHYLTAYGDTMSLKQWAKDPRCEVSYVTMFTRTKQGWLGERVLQRIVAKSSSKRVTVAPTYTAWGETKPACDWAKDKRCKVNYQTIVNRLRSKPWPFELIISIPTHRARGFKNAPIQAIAAAAKRFGWLPK